MHGRLKVKTTEQQEKEKKIERAAKLKSYRQVRAKYLRASLLSVTAVINHNPPPPFKERV